MRRFFLLTVCLLGIAVNALGKESDKGILKDTEFVIDKERKNLLEEAFRLFESAPTATPANDFAQLPPSIPLAIWPPFDVLPRKVKLLRAKQDVVTQLYGNYLQAGHGNFYTPYLEWFVTNTRDPRHAYGLHFKHLSMGKMGYREENHNLIQLYGKLFTDTLCHTGEVDYKRDSYPLYGSEGKKQVHLGKQSIDHFLIRYTLADYSDGPINYQAKSLVHYLAAPSQLQETQGIIQANADYVLTDEYTLKTAADLCFTKYKDTSRNLFRLTPSLAFTVQKFDIEAGLNLVYQDSDTQKIDPLNLYPVIEIKYPVHQAFRPYVGIRGDIKQSSLQNLLQENPRLANNTALRHTDQRFIYGGVRGELMEQVSFHTGLLAGIYKNLHYFVNSPTHPGLFEVNYATTKFVNVFSELTYINQAESWTTRLRGDYFRYSPEDLPQPWHRPSYQLDLLSTYQWHDKVIFKGSLYCLGGIKAQHEATKEVKKLSPTFDVGLGVDYLWNSRISIFLDCQNLLANLNERHLHYPARGFQFVAGLTYGW